MAEFNEILKKLMEKKGLNAEQLSNQLDKNVKISANTIRNYIKGDTKPNCFEYYKTLADFFNVSTDYIQGYAKEPSTDIKVKEINKKYGLCEDALKNLALLNSHDEIFKETKTFKDFGTTIDTINFLLSEKMDNNNISILQLIDFYLNTEPSKKYILALQEKGNVKLYDKTEKTSKFMSGKAFLSGDMLVEGILVEIINRLKKLKEGENNECKRTRKK